MKHFLMIIGCLFTLSIMGQKEVVSAYNANKDGDYRAASTYIEQAIIVEKSKTKEKTWRYRGNIYLNISRDTTLAMEFPNALRTAMESFLKAQEYDVKGRYEDEIKLGLANVQTDANGFGITHYNTTSFDKAGVSFDLASEVARKFDMVDTMAIYNAALCYEKAGLNDLAIDRYKECADIEYQVPNVFLFISTLYRNAENDEEALKILQGARVTYPREQSLIIEELNIYLTNQDFERAKANLELAAEQDIPAYKSKKWKGSPGVEFTILAFCISFISINLFFGLIRSPSALSTTSLEIEEWSILEKSTNALSFNRAPSRSRTLDVTWLAIKRATSSLRDRDICGF